MGGLFGEIEGGGEEGAERVTAVRPVGRDGRLVSVVVGRRSAGRVPPEVAERLGARSGAAWTAALAGAVAAAAAAEAAHEAALKRLARRARSEAEVREWLAARGHAPEAIGEAVARLRASGLISDEALSRAVVARVRERAPAGAALIEDRLRRRGLETPEGLVGPAGDAAGALALARAEAARTLPGGDWAKAARRILGVLARRGFEADVAEEAVRTALSERGAALPGGVTYDP